MRAVNCVQHRSITGLNWSIFFHLQTHIGYIHMHVPLQIYLSTHLLHTDHIISNLELCPCLGSDLVHGDARRQLSQLETAIDAVDLEDTLDANQ
jgi:hypothetical protein